MRIKYFPKIIASGLFLLAGCAERIGYVGNFVIDERIVEIQERNSGIVIDDYWSNRDIAEKKYELEKYYSWRVERAKKKDVYWKDRIICDSNLKMMSFECIRDGNTFIATKKETLQKAEERVKRIKSYVDGKRIKRFPKSSLSP